MNVASIAASIGSKNIKGLVKRAKAEASRQKQDKTKPGHVHKSDSNNNSGGGGLLGVATQLPGGRPESSIPPTPGTQPDSVMPSNSFVNGKAQSLGKGMWQGEQMAAQQASRQSSTPTPIPGQQESIGGAYGEMFMSPLSQNTRKDGDDASVFGSIIRGAKSIIKGIGQGNRHMDGPGGNRPPTLPGKDYKNHPEVQAHNEHAKRTNKQ